ncbi:arsenate reductase [Sulfurirhabdus autotrophica]|uniref:Arsenate reductase n=2 Tax=Sulfurirhabdus autotrophica TaxID=1706046 RepID=A0A4V2W1G8_9PROT|nr:arsenate reductase [Sulfurirhabdus autotrophica]
MEGRPAVLKKQGHDSVAADVMQEMGVSCDGGDLDELNEALLNWADLVVLMDKLAEAQCPPLPHGVQKRSYFFDDPAELADSAIGQLESYRKIRDQIKRRVEGMIGGLKMLQKASE